LSNITGQIGEFGSDREIHFSASILPGDTVSVLALALADLAQDDNAAFILEGRRAVAYRRPARLE
jgi:hypothetical protein